MTQDKLGLDYEFFDSLISWHILEAKRPNEITTLVANKTRARLRNLVDSNIRAANGKITSQAIDVFSFGNYDAGSR